jgi:hypothetical protein
MTKRAACSVLLLAAAGAYVAGTRSVRREVAAASPPAGGAVAWVEDRRCVNGPCESFWIGADRQHATNVLTLDGWGRCTEISWTRDARLVAFLIDGGELHVYDAAARKPAGQLTLVPQPVSGAPGSVVRGITFSDNGRAITFDECPRGRSGCRAGIAAVPYK